MNVQMRVHVRGILNETRDEEITLPLSIVVRAASIADAYYRQYGEYTKVSGRVVFTLRDRKVTIAVKEERGAPWRTATDSTSTSPEDTISTVGDPALVSSGERSSSS